MTISSARTMFIVNIESFKNQNPNLKDNGSNSKSKASKSVKWAVLGLLQLLELISRKIEVIEKY